MPKRGESENWMTVIIVNGIANDGLYSMPWTQNSAAEQSMTAMNVSRYHTFWTLVKPE